MAAARSALGGLGDIGGAIGASAGPRGAALGRDLGAALGSNVASWLPQQELEYELEDEFGVGLNPIRRVYPAALMEHLGHVAAEAESEQEAEAFLPALVPLAAQILPRVAPVLMRAAPQLIGSVTRIGRTLMRNPSTRPLIRTVPTIVRRTASTLAQRAAAGQRVTPQTAVQTLARQAARTLGSPTQALQAYRCSRALDRHHHRLSAASAAAPREVG